MREKTMSDPLTWIDAADAALEGAKHSRPYQGWFGTVDPDGTVYACVEGCALLTWHGRPDAKDWSVYEALALWELARQYERRWGRIPAEDNDDSPGGRATALRRVRILRQEASPIEEERPGPRPSAAPPGGVA